MVWLGPYGVIVIGPAWAWSSPGARRPPFADRAVAGVLAARLTFVAFYFAEYRTEPWRMLDIRDGGFLLLHQGGGGFLEVF